MARLSPLHRLLPLLTCFALLCLPAAGDHAREATIATWNLAGNTFLRGLDGTDAARQQKQLARRAAGVIAAFSPDLLVLTEVPSEEFLKRLRQELAEQFGRSYRYRFSKEERWLHLAVLYSDRVRLRPLSWIEGSDLGSVNARRLRRAWVTMVEIDAFDFRLVGVHFKSGGRAAEIRSPKKEILRLSATEVRRRQASRVGEYLARTVARGWERDLVVAGDFNMTPKRDAAAFEALGADGTLRFLSTEALCRPRRGKVRCQGTYLFKDGGRGSLLDGIAVSRRHTSEYVEGSLRVLLPKELMREVPGLTGRPSLRSFREHISDHLPIVARFRTDRDDD